MKLDSKSIAANDLINFAIKASITLKVDELRDLRGWILKECLEKPDDSIEEAEQDFYQAAITYLNRLIELKGKE